MDLGPPALHVDLAAMLPSAFISTASKDQEAISQPAQQLLGSAERIFGSTKTRPLGPWALAYLE